MAGAAFCAPRLAFFGVVQHLDFNSQWGEGMAIEIVLSVQDGPRADFGGNVRKTEEVDLHVNLG